MKCGLSKEDVITAKQIAEQIPMPTIEEDYKWNTLIQNRESENMLFRGDNLNVLTHLSLTHANKIKFIYIDPPYNIGKNSLYQDNYNGHEKYLDFIYPRLYLACKLLKDDGVFALSIDDCELEYVKMALNSIFGEKTI